MFIFFCWWKNKHKCRNVSSGGEVKTAVADTPCKFIFIKAELAFIPFLHWHPADSLFYPLIESKLSESILLAGSFLCRITRRYNFIHSDSLVK